jgi:hypothetical protein
MSFIQKHFGEFLLTILIAIYLVVGWKTPQPISNLLNTIIGKLILLCIVIFLFCYSNPFLAILALYAAFHLISKSGMNTELRAMQQFIPSENVKMGEFSAWNQFPYTLEQEIVKKMAPIVRSGSSLMKATYKPLLEGPENVSAIF